MFLTYMTVVAWRARRTSVWRRPEWLADAMTADEARLLGPELARV
jgi:hypothetical protein